MEQTSSSAVWVSHRNGPATGVDPLVHFRLPIETQKRVDEWGRQAGLSRSHTFRLWVEQGLARKPPKPQKVPKRTRPSEGQ